MNITACFLFFFLLFSGISTDVICCIVIHLSKIFSLTYCVLYPNATFKFVKIIKRHILDVSCITC